jgi:hypothetical protein
MTSLMIISACLVYETDNHRGRIWVNIERHVSASESDEVLVTTQFGFVTNI